MRRSRNYKPCAICGNTTNQTVLGNRVRHDGIIQIVCASCRYRLPDALARFLQGDSPGQIIQSMNIPKLALMRFLRKRAPLICQGTCQKTLSDSETRRLHPVSGALLCNSCHSRSRLPCISCRRSVRLPEGVINQETGGHVTFTCRRCQSQKALQAQQKCSEPGCGTAIGPGLEYACRHPEDPTRRVCSRCYDRIYNRLGPGYTCSECGKTFNGRPHYLHPQASSQYVCMQCYRKLSGYFETKTGPCPSCDRERPLLSTDPRYPTRKVCTKCYQDLSAPRKIVRLSQATITWPRPHQQLFDAALQKGSTTSSDLNVLRGLIHCQPFLPPSLDLSAPGLNSLHRWIRNTSGIPIRHSQRQSASAAIWRALLELHGKLSPEERYRILLNRRPLTQPTPVTELLLDFVLQELPKLHYNRSTVQHIFFALRRFFSWLAEHYPGVYFLRQIQPEHFVHYRIHQAITISATKALRLAWRAFAPFATARGHHIKIEKTPWEDLDLPMRRAPVYPNPLELFQGLDTFAQDNRQPPLSRMLAHLLTLAAPSLDEFRFASIPMQTLDGIPILRRHLTASRCIAFGGFSPSRRRQQNYRQLASQTPLMPLRPEPPYLALYEAVDAERKEVLKGINCPFLFVTSKQRICPDIPLSMRTSQRILHQTLAAAGLPNVNLTLLRNTHALLVAQHVWPRPAIIAATTGRSFHFATRILRSMDLDSNSGLQPLPKTALVSRYGEPLP